jgi:hypothetical protein
MRSPVASLVLAPILAFVLVNPSLCRASGTEKEVPDAAGLQQLELQAQHAEAREQAYLYTELVQVYTQVAGKQMASGEMDKANATLQRIRRFAALIHENLARNAKRLKDAEMMLHTATYHLGQYMHMVSGEDQPTVASTLHDLDKVHDELLTQVFAH